MYRDKVSITHEDLDSGIIYLILNLQNNKTYVGLTSFPRKRWHDHITQDKLLVDKEIDKYGRDNFIFVILEECPKEKLSERELYWIKRTKSYEHGYNEKEW